MSHFGRSGPPDIKNTYSLLILNITFRTSADDLFPLFDRYGKVVDIFIPRDRRTGEARGFAFVRYKHMDEARKAMEKLDGVNVNGRDIVVQLAKYGRSMEKLQRGQITSGNSNWNNRSDSQSPRRISGRRYGNDYYDRELRREDNDYGRFERNRYRETSRDFQRSGRSHGHSRSPNRGRSHSHSRSRSRGHRRARDYHLERSEGRSFEKNVSQQVSRGSLSPRRLSSPDCAMSPGPSRPQRKYLSPARRSASEVRADASPAQQNARLPASRSRSVTPIDQRPATASPEDEVHFGDTV